MKRSTNEEIACVLNISMRKIDRVKKRFVEEGIEVALNGKKGSRIYAKKVDGDFEAHLVAVSCSCQERGVGMAEFLGQQKCESQLAIHSRGCSNKAIST